MNKTFIREKYVLKEPINKMIKKLLKCIIILLLGMITIKGNSNMAKIINKELYEKSISFVKMNELSKRYLGSIIPKVTELEKEVFDETQIFNDIEEINDGVKVSTNINNPVKVLENGMIMMIDENMVVIEQIDGVKVTYENITNNNYKLYDYLEKGEILGLPKSSEVIIHFTKEGEKVDYKKYF